MQRSLRAKETVSCPSSPPSDDVIMPHSARKRLHAMLRAKKIEMSPKMHDNLPF